MEINKIYCGNSLDLIKELDIAPKLIVMSPPDQNETPYTFEQYTDFIHTIYNDCFDKLEDGGVLFSITTDRKYEGKILLKHNEIINSLKNKSTQFNYKIWAKSLKANLYILTFAHMMFFCKGKKPKTKNKTTDFYPDVWLLDQESVEGYPKKDSFPTQLITRVIMEYTNPGDIILDPFIGSGKTSKVAIDNDRKFIGFDLSQEFVNIAEKYTWTL